MQSVLKSFRLPEALVNFLERKAKTDGVSQTDVLIESIETMMNKENQWKQDLKFIACDPEYLKEQVALAEEHYE